MALLLNFLRLSTASHCHVPVEFYAIGQKGEGVKDPADQLSAMLVVSIILSRISIVCAVVVFCCSDDAFCHKFRRETNGIKWLQLQCLCVSDGARAFGRLLGSCMSNARSCVIASLSYLQYAASAT